MAKVRIDVTTYQDICLVIAFVKEHADEIGNYSLSSAEALRKGFLPDIQEMTNTDVSILITWAKYLRDKLGEYEFNCDAHRIMSGITVALECLKLEINRQDNHIPNWTV